MIEFKVFTLFPEMFPGPLSYSVTGLALKNSLWKISPIDIRKYAKDSRGTIDDIPYGGGAGMVIKPDVITDAVEKNNIQKGKLIYLSPRGTILNQKKARELAQENEIAILCGRYEGVDQRALEELQVEEISIGDYILSGGEIASYVLIDAILRNVKGVVGDENSIKEESFSIAGNEFLLEYPHYTRPAKWRNREVPEVLISGHHQNIKSWRLEKSIEITKNRRQDLHKKFLENNS